MCCFLRTAPTNVLFSTATNKAATSQRRAQRRERQEQLPTAAASLCWVLTHKLEEESVSTPPSLLVSPR